MDIGVSEGRQAWQQPTRPYNNHTRVNVHALRTVVHKTRTSGQDPVQLFFLNDAERFASVLRFLIEVGDIFVGSGEGLHEI